MEALGDEEAPGKSEDTDRETLKNKSTLKNSLQRYITIFAAEVLGTAFILFFGCMACAGVSAPSYRAPIVFGAAVMTAISIAGHISEAHFNPAVTVAFYLLDHISFLDMFVYFIAEACGAILGTGLMVCMTPPEDRDSSTCITAPGDSVTVLQALGIEFMATSALVLLVCAVTDHRAADKQDSAPLKFGVLITALAMCCGHLSGASLNPARSLGPAIYMGTWTAHWIYWVGPLAAGVICPIFYNNVFLKNT